MKQIGITHMKPFITFILIFYCFINSGSAARLFIRVSVMDYKSSYNSISLLDKIDKKLDPTLVYHSTYASEIKRFNVEILHLDDHIPFLISDSLYDKLSDKNYSTVHLIDKNKEVFTCLLKDLPLYLNKINNVLTESNKNDSITDINISSNSTYLHSEHFIFEYSNIFHDIKIIPINNIAKTQIFKVTPDLVKKSFKIAFPDDTGVYQSHLRLLNKSNGLMALPEEITNIWNDNDSLYALITLLYPTVVNIKGNEYTKLSKLNVLCLILRESEARIWVIGAMNSLKYDFDEGGDFFIHNGKYYFSVFKPGGIDVDNFFLGQWISENEYLKFNGIVNIDLPKIFIDHRIDYDLTSFTYHWPYLMLNISNTLIDLRSKETITLPLSEGKTNFSKISEKGKVDLKFSITDFIIKDHLLRLIYYNGKSYKISTIDLVSVKKINDEALSNKSKFLENIVSPQFLDFNSILYLGKKSNKLHLIRLNL